MESSLIIKLLGLLEATAGQSEGRSLSDLAAEVGLTKPTAHRILKTLTMLGYMERIRPGIYRQAAQIRRLISGGDDGRLIRCAEASLRALHQATEETVNLGVLRQGRVVYLTVLESPQPLRRIVNPNMSDPYACTALGRAIVAQLPVERREFLVRNTILERRTPVTVVDPSKLLAILEEVRKSGYSVEESETDLGVVCIGAPLFEGTVVVGAISLTVPTVRDNRERRGRFIAAVQQTAEKITQALEKSP